MPTSTTSRMLARELGVSHATILEAIGQYQSLLGKVGVDHQSNTAHLTGRQTKTLTELLSNNTKDSATEDKTEKLIEFTNAGAVTTSLIIANGTRNEHRVVLQLIRGHVASLEKFGRVTFETQPFQTAGGTQKREIAYLNERQATLLLTMMRNSDVIIEFKTRLVQAFYELATRPQDYASKLSRLEILRMATESEERALAAESQVEELLPQAKIAQRIAIAKGSLCISSAAKVLQRAEKQFFDYLSKTGWIYRRHKTAVWLGYSDKVKAGLLEHKVTIDENGKEVITEQVRVTPKGLIKLAHEFNVTIDEEGK